MKAERGGRDGVTNGGAIDGGAGDRASGRTVTGAVTREGIEYVEPLIGRYVRARLS